MAVQDEPGNKSPESTPAPNKAASLPFPVVGIGASAGGQEALVSLLENLPADAGLALIVVVHLDPNHTSLLPTILTRSSRLPVVEATDGMAVEVNRVHVIPPNVLMALTDGHLHLTPRPGGPGPHMPIDHLFRSLAAVQRNLAVGIVLSGGGTDGTLGLLEISAEGIAIAQDEHSARHDAMPRSAVASGCVDFVLPPAEIARELLRIARHPYATQPDLRGEVGPDEQDSVSSLFSVLRATMGMDFSHYKRSTINRRVRRRMALRNLNRVDDYLRLLTDEPAELQALYQDLLIRVTSFFRDPASFQALQEIVFPRLLADRPRDEPIRIWVAGCSTGEEVYSLAIALMEVLGEAANATPVKILATDVNEAALDRARAGVFLENIESDVSPERLRRYFFKLNGHYQISKAVRDLCVFSRHNLVSDPPFSKLDLVSCRNVLIYLDLTLQKRVMPIFHYALKPGGFLLLGSAETIGSFGDLFDPVSDKQKVFVRRPTAPLTLPFDFDVAGLGGERRPPDGGRPDGRTWPPLDMQREADRVVLARYGPPGVVVDDNLNILQFRGQTSPFLEPTPGIASLNLLKMVRDPLVVDLRKLLLEAKAENAPARKERLPLKEGDHFRYVTVEVVPIKGNPGGKPACYLVLFTEVPPPTPPTPPDGAADPSASEQRIVQLEQELTTTREYLQSVVEEHEATTEELKSAHEEILSANEELQSTNEELQTAKEEMQSANEELNTVNEELRHRNAELARANDDLVNLFNGVNLPIVMVSRDLRIRRMTPMAEKVFNLIPTDVGRSFGDIRPNLNVPDLDKQIAEVISTLAVKDVDSQDRSGRWYSVRIRPYVTLDNKIEGVSVVSVDTDALKRSLEQTQQARDNAEAVVNAVPQPVLVLDGELRVRRANPAFVRLTGRPLDQMFGQALPALGHGVWGRPALQNALTAVIHDGRPFENFELTAEFGSGGRELLLHGEPIHWDGAAERMALLVIEDVTDRRRRIGQEQLLTQEQAARQELELANRTKDEFLAMLAHELRNPLAPLRNILHVLRRILPSPTEQETTLLDVGDRQVTHMARLLDDLLDVARVSKGKIELKKQPVDVAVVVAGAAASVRQAAEAAGHMLDVRPPAEPVWLDADPLRLEQLLVNVLTNAVKYTPRGGRIEFSAAWDNGMAVFQVSDTGIGISADMLPRVFDLFSQADRALDRSQGGLGIGLTLVKRLVDLHGGTIEAASPGAGKGSTFTIRLPATRGKLPAAPAPGPAPQPFAARRVLLVDDHHDGLDSLAQLLRLEGHEVRTAPDGPAALTAAAAELPDVVFLDIGLPGMDGYEIARRLRQLPRADRMRLVALTGYGQHEDRQRAADAGFDEHLVKPLDPEELRRLLGSADGHPAGQ